MNLPVFVNYIWFIILRVNYNYISKLQLVMIDCLGCDQLYDLQCFPIIILREGEVWEFPFFKV